MRLFILIDHERNEFSYPDCENWPLILFRACIFPDLRNFNINVFYFSDVISYVKRMQ
jgi:hypothetical protein